MNRTLLLAIAIAAIPAHAQQMYKCDQGGTVTFSEFPCGKNAKKIDVKPVAGETATVPLAAVAPAPQGGRSQALLDEMTRQRRIREIEYEIRNAENDMDAELEGLRRKKGNANNNLAGATWLTSISQEMQAVTAKWRGKIDQLNSQLAALRQQ